ncbi:MAG: hypothetical protein ACYCRD_03670 [Leptospirillum sp.]
MVEGSNPFAPTSLSIFMVLTPGTDADSLFALAMPDLQILLGVP